jgi:hypothetical protein
MISNKLHTTSALPGKRNIYPFFIVAAWQLTVSSAAKEMQEPCGEPLHPCVTARMTDVAIAGEHPDRGRLQPMPELRLFFSDETDARENLFDEPLTFVQTGD